MSSQWRPGEIVIEIGGTNNNNNYYLFRPTLQSLRGKWSARNQVNPSARRTRFTACPDIPGIMAALDPHKRTLRTVDPLGFPENKKLLADAVAIKEKYFGKEGPWASTLKKNLTDAQLKTALWAMSEMVRAGSATVVNGALPAPDKIMAMEGRFKARMIKRNPEAGHPDLEASPEEEQMILANATAE